MSKLLSWLDDNILSVLAGFLLVFIPLYPKLPIGDILPGYIVRVRLEDFIVSFCVFLWVVWLVRGKTRLSGNPLFKPILAYLVVGVLSMLSAVFLLHTVPLIPLHLEKMFLHYARRIEYFSLFFIFYSSVRSLKQLKIYIGLIIVTVVAVSIYGFGQRYLYWPAFSTMNREFAKGWMLYLTPHARVLSTFGGHYDLAAYIMMALVLLWSLFFGVKRKLLKLLIFLTISAAFWTLILTASRTSFIAYLFGITVIFFFWAYKKGMSWSLTRWFTVIFLSILVMLSFGDLSERFTKFLRIDERLSGVKSLLLTPLGAPPPPDKAVFLENNPNAALSQITSSSDQPPTPDRPIDVYKNIPLMVPTGTNSASLAAVPRTYSKTAFIYDLSTAIRFDALWPMAIKGFERNPLLGSGYSTLNKTQPTQFTEAESTDNDFLRNLGETGVLGFITFFGTLLFIVFIIWRNLNLFADPFIFSITIGFAGLLMGLMVNALYIDVFESSKVAFMFWGITGFVLAGVEMLRKERKREIPFPRIPDLSEFISGLIHKSVSFIKSDKFILLVILVFAFTVRLYKIDEPLADWHSWRQADTSAVTRNYVKHGINILFPTYDDLSNVASGKNNPKGLRFVEFPLYNVLSVVTDKIFVGWNIEVSGRLTSIFATLGSIIFLFLLVRKYLGRREAAIAAAVFAFLPYNIFFTRTILPDPLLVCTSIGMIWFLDLFLDSKQKLKLSGEKRIVEIVKVILYLFLAGVFTAAALLVKPYAVFLFLPMSYLWVRKMGFSVKSFLGLVLFFGISSLPLGWWRWWISHFPEGVPANLWLLNGDGIRFKGAFFYWLFADRLSRLILGYWGLPFLILGILAPIKKDKFLFYLWGIAILAYVTVFATGNVRHDYYQILTVPIIAVFVAKGITFFADMGRKYRSGILVFGLIGVTIVFTEMFGWYFVRDYYNINHPEIVEAGRAVDTKTPQSALVIAPYDGDTAFLYQTHRAGWPVMQESIDKMINMGADYYVSVNFDDLTKQLMAEAQIADPAKRKYKIAYLTNKYVIIQLVPDGKLPKN